MAAAPRIEPQKKGPYGPFRYLNLAEREGFEPSIRFCRIHTFQACAFDRSATSPGNSSCPGAYRRRTRGGRLPQNQADCQPRAGHDGYLSPLRGV